MSNIGMRGTPYGAPKLTPIPDGLEDKLTQLFDLSFKDSITDYIYEDLLDQDWDCLAAWMDHDNDETFSDVFLKGAAVGIQLAGKLKAGYVLCEFEWKTFQIWFVAPSLEAIEAEADKKSELLTCKHVMES